PARGRAGPCANPAARPGWRCALPLVGLLSEQDGDATRREVGDVPRDGLEARGRHALLSGLLGVPAKVGLAIDGGRLPSGPGSELQQLAARVPDFLRMR